MNQSAPPVRLHGGVDTAWLWCCRVLAVLVGGGSALWWLWLGDRAGWIIESPWAWRAVVPAITGLAAVWVWQLPVVPAWELRWDGAVWYAGPPGLADTACQVQVALDFDRWLLLRIDGLPGAAWHWLAVTETRHAAAWHGLRCALYCARPTPVSWPGGPTSPS